MGDRLGSRDLELLTRESDTAPRHNASVEILDPGEPPFDYVSFVDLVADRLAFVPRYRQRVRMVPGRFANPVWVDDQRFDLEYHVRRSALPRPGSQDQLRDLAARILSRPLDHSRPLWEMYFIEGLADGRVAVLSKTHQALVDGVHTVDLGQLLFDSTPSSGPLGEDVWNPRTPSGPAVLLGALRDVLTDADTLPAAIRSAGGTAVHRLSDTAAATVSGIRRFTGGGGEDRSPLAGELSQQRRVVMVETRLADYRRIRDGHGGTINDVILAVVAGGLRGWMQTRGESTTGLHRVPAVVPVSVIDDDLEATSLGTQIAPHYVDLPVGEASAVVRLHQVSYSFERHKETSRVVGADRLAGISGFAPATFHAMGARVAAAEGTDDYALSVTNVPGPQEPRYAGGARIVASYPIHPLEAGHSVAIGVTSYDGGVFFGVTADRDLVTDADVIGQCLGEALDELLDTVSGSRQRAPRGAGDASGHRRTSRKPSSRGDRS